MEVCWCVDFVTAVECVAVEWRTDLINFLRMLSGGHSYVSARVLCPRLTKHSLRLRWLVIRFCSRRCGSSLSVPIFYLLRKSLGCDFSNSCFLPLDTPFPLWVYTLGYILSVLEPCSLGVQTVATLCVAGLSSLCSFRLKEGKRRKQFSKKRCI